MSIEIISLTQDKGFPLSRSIRHNNDPGWKIIYFLKKMGGQSTRDRITTFCFGGDVSSANSVISNLKSKGIIN
jgi:hypothetical protein